MKRRRESKVKTSAVIPSPPVADLRRASDSPLPPPPHLPHPPSPLVLFVVLLFRFLLLLLLLLFIFLRSAPPPPPLSRRLVSQFGISLTGHQIFLDEHRDRVSQALNRGM